LLAPHRAAGQDGKADSLPPPQTVAELQSRIEAIMEQQKVPSVGIALVHRDSVIWMAGLGKQDVASNTAASTGTLYRIGSTSKAFVPLLLLLMEQEGKLSLDDPVSKYAPEIQYQNPWEATDPVLIVHLLEHTAGWDDLSLRDYGHSDSTPISLKEGLDYTPRTRTSRWRPGTRVSYSNSGPSVAAYIAEKLEARPFEELVRERLFTPIGMPTATYLRDPALRDRMATLYRADGVTPYPYWHVLQRPAGSINASPIDMAAYVRFLLNRGAVDGKQLLPAATIEAMERPRSSGTAKAGLTVGYGLHLATYADSGFVWMGHDGGVSGGITTMAYRPDASVGFCFMITSANGAAVTEINRLVRKFLTRDEAPPAVPAAGPMPAEAPARTGWYRSDNPRAQFAYFAERIMLLTRVRVADSTLILKPLLGSAKTYLPVEGMTFRGVDEPVATLALTSNPEDGRDAGIEQVGYLLPTQYHRVPSAVALAEVAITVAWLTGMVLTLLFALVWIPRKLFGRLKHIRRLGPRVWPLLAALSIVGFTVVFIMASGDLLNRLGRPTAYAWGLFLFTLLFPLAALAGLLSARRSTPKDAGRFARGHGLVVSVLNLIVAVYLAWWGVVGWRPWA
jgi:CubicO group peptidase (beta-lactamase class C family)